MLLSREDEFKTWLADSSNEALSLAQSYTAESMHIVQNGADKHDLLNQPALGTPVAQGMLLLCLSD